MIETPRRLKVRIRDSWGSLYDQEIDVFGLDQITASLVRTSFARTFPEDILKRVKEGQKIAEAFNSWRSEVERAVFGTIYSEPRIKTPSTGFYGPSLLRAAYPAWFESRLIESELDRLRRRLYDLPDLGSGSLEPYPGSVSGGSFRMKFFGATTDPIRYDATGKEIDDAVNRTRANIIDEAAPMPFDYYERIAKVLESGYQKKTIALSDGSFRHEYTVPKGTENETQI